MHWIDQRSSVPLIQQLNAQADAWRAIELARARKLLAKGEPADKVLEHLSHRLTNKILHAPTQALNLAEGAERAELQAAAARLFHLHSGE